jgi:hypothetical protein
VRELVAKERRERGHRKEGNLEFGSYQGCRGFRIELRVGVEESSGKRLSGGCDPQSVVRISCRDSRETQL